MCLGLGGAMLLGGCVRGTSNPEIRLICPEIVQYSKEIQQRAANELDALPDGSVVGELVTDYLQLRDKIRICEEGMSK